MGEILDMGVGKAVMHPVAQNVGVFVLLLFFALTSFILAQDRDEPSTLGLNKLLGDRGEGTWAEGSESKMRRRRRRVSNTKYD
jgi:hypothetical protein